MKLKLSLTANSRFLIKMEYKSALQAVIYSMLDEKFANSFASWDFKEV